MGFKDLAAANEIVHLELNPPQLSWLVADKKEMTIFGSDSITAERERALTGCRQRSRSSGMI